MALSRAGAARAGHVNMCGDHFPHGFREVQLLDIPGRLERPTRATFSPERWGTSAGGHPPGDDGRESLRRPLSESPSQRRGLPGSRVVGRLQLTERERRFLVRRLGLVQPGGLLHHSLGLNWVRLFSRAVGSRRERDDVAGIASLMDAIALSSQVVPPVLVEVAVAAQGVELQDRFGAFQAPSGAS